MNILEQIIADKKREVAQKKQLLPMAFWKMMEYYDRPTVSLKTSIKNTMGIITEFKRQSPSKGIINHTATVEDVVMGYDINGSACMSILTDEKYFGGTNDDVLNARMVTDKPILRKEFIIDEYQLIEAKAIGADVILLIAACLSPTETNRLATFAKNLDLEVLLELHTAEELDHVCDAVDLVGINNRNLKTFEVNWQHSIDLAAQLPKDKLKIAESGIHSVETLLMLQQNGFDGFLIGEKFMQQNDPAIAFATFVNELKKSPLYTGA